MNIGHGGFHIPRNGLRHIVREFVSHLGEFRHVFQYIAESNHLSIARVALFGNRRGEFRKIKSGIGVYHIVERIESIEPGVIKWHQGNPRSRIKYPRGEGENEIQDAKYTADNMRHETPREIH